MHLSQNQCRDLREVFVYRLLELLKIGPKVHFLPNTHHSGFGLYALWIATEDVREFHRCFGRRRELNDEQKMQLYLLICVFCLVDLNSCNFGTDGDGKLWVVDFMIDNLEEMTVEKANTYWTQKKGSWNKAEAVRIKVAKEIFAKCNLENVVNEADIAISKQKKLLKKCNTGQQSIMEYGRYLKNVNRNIKELSKRFGQE